MSRFGNKSPRSWPGRLWRRLARWTTILTVMAAMAGGGLIGWLSTSLPRQEGEITVPGLDRPVTISRDKNGVPVIKARSGTGVHFGLGFAHAQDRLFQMDIMRRTGAGRLAEVLGPASLDHDRQARLLGFYRRAEAGLQYLLPDTVAALEAYAAGVNAFLETRSGSLPVEFVLLGYEPEPWQPADSLVWSRLMAMWLSNNRREELLRAQLAEILSPAEINLVLGIYPADGPQGVTNSGVNDGKTKRNGPISVLPRKDSPGETGPAQELAAALWAALPAGERQERLSASNNWAVAGQHTRSGLPLLANDPHLWLSTPGVWYLARMEAPDYQAGGGTMPGTPFVVAGHNDRIAWGFTSTHSDTQDYFIERLVPGDNRRYLTPDGSQHFIQRTETIKVLGKPDVTLITRESRHGPVMSDLSDNGPMGLSEGHVLALADTALEDDMRTAQAIYRFNKARDWEEFTEALRDFHGPQQNIVYADRAGHIGFYAPGRAPIRKAGDGSAPMPGWNGVYDWISTINFDRLPHIYDPGEGHIVTANHKIVLEAYPYLLTSHWRNPYRAGRIYKQLAAGDDRSPEATARLQNDVVSEMARDLLPAMLTIKGRDKPTLEALRRLKAWDGGMRREASEPLIFKTWLRVLYRRLLHEPLGDLFSALSRPQPLLIKAALNGKTRFCRGENAAVEESKSEAGIEMEEKTEAEAGEADPPPYCRDILAESLSTALGALRVVYGRDMKDWRWGATHTASFINKVMDYVPYLQNLKGAVIETGGDNYTVNRGSSGAGMQTADHRSLTEFPHVHGAGLRAIYDLAAPWQSRFMITPGQSENLFSPHSHNLVRRWRDGEYITFPHNGQDNPGAKILVLLPKTANRVP